MGKIAKRPAQAGFKTPFTSVAAICVANSATRAAVLFRYLKLYLCRRRVQTPLNRPRRLLLPSVTISILLLVPGCFPSTWARHTITRGWGSPHPFFVNVSLDKHNLFGQTWKACTEKHQICRENNVQKTFPNMKKEINPEIRNSTYSRQWEQQCLPFKHPVKNSS